MRRGSILRWSDWGRTPTVSTGRPRGVPAEQADEARRLRRGGMSWREIKDRLGLRCSRWAVRRAVLLLGAYRPP